jgi:hypothetical protein
MSLQRLSAFLPSPRTLFTVVFSSILGGAVSLAVFAWIIPHGSSPKPVPPHDPRFVTLGRGYLSGLGIAYAGAWEDGATLLDSGQGLSTALDTIKKSWAANRAQLFDHVVTPEFAKLIPEATKDADVPPQTRAALSAAWRGFAMGLRR